MADYSRRIHRLLRIITLIQGDRSLTPKRLADVFESTERTIFRDLEDLRTAGVPIDFDQEIGGYVIRRDYFLKPTELSLEESLSLCLLAEQIPGTEQLPHTLPAKRAIEKVRSNLPPKLQTELEQVMPHVNIDLARGENSGSADVFDTVRSAIRHRRALTCTYESQRRLTVGQSFRFDPYALHYGQRAWYVIGLRHNDGAVRTLKLSRFTQCLETDQPFLIPDDFSIASYFGNAWRMVRDDTRYNISLRFSSAVAETVADTWWHSTQQVEYHDDDSVTIRFEVDGLKEIVWWVLSYGPHCEVLEPATLREQVRDLSDATRTLYTARP